MHALCYLKKKEGLYTMMYPASFHLVNLHYMRGFHSLQLSYYRESDSLEILKDETFTTSDAFSPIDKKTIETVATIMKNSSRDIVHVVLGPSGIYSFHEDPANPSWSIRKELCSPVVQSIMNFFSLSLHRAVIKGDLEKAEHLIIFCPPCIDMHDHEGYTPLHRATSCDKYEMADLLLRLGATAGTFNSNNETPLLTFCKQTLPSLNIRVKERICHYIDRGADVGTELFIAKDSDLSNSDTIIEALIPYINKPDSYGYTPLHRAIKDKDLPRIKMLIELNADIDTYAMLNSSPLITFLQQQLHMSEEGENLLKVLIDQTDITSNLQEAIERNQEVVVHEILTNPQSVAKIPLQSRISIITAFIKNIDNYEKGEEIALALMNDWDNIHEQLDNSVIMEFALRAIELNHTKVVFKLLSHTPLEKLESIFDMQIGSNKTLNDIMGNFL
jgi:hypothetical protein